MSETTEARFTTNRRKFIQAATATTAALSVGDWIAAPRAGAHGNRATGPKGDPSIDPALWSVSELAAAIRRREIGAAELLEHYLQRVDELNPAINALVTFDIDRARQRAAAADAATMTAGTLPALHGVPYTIKDAIATEGVRTTGGGIELANNVPSEDATVMRRLRAAGANLFAKSNLPRWSGDMQTYNELFCTTNNPWDLTRTPGGSSGGSAAAVASGMTTFDVGTDISGSIRGPAHLCGVCGHKPSYGVVSALGYIDHVTAGLTEPDVNVLGPLARTVDDLTLLFDIIAGPTEDRAVAWQLQLPGPRAARFSDYRIAAWLDDPACPVSNDVAAALDGVVQAIENDGVPVDRSARPGIDPEVVRRLGLPLIKSATSPDLTVEEFEHARQIVANPTGHNPAEVAQARASTVLHRDWLLATEAREQVRRMWARFFVDHDILLCPVLIIPAFEHLQEGTIPTRVLTVDGVTRPYADVLWWAVLIGMAYLPSTVVPVGWTAGGLPIGIQVVGPFLGDRSTLEVAGQIERLTGGYRVPPIAQLGN